MKIKIIAYLFDPGVQWDRQMKPHEAHALLRKEYVTDLTDDIRIGLTGLNQVIKVNPDIACRPLRPNQPEDGIPSYEVGATIASFERTYLEKLFENGWVLGTSEQVRHLGLRELLSAS